MLDLALAFAAGLLTVAAPCILPMLPLILGASVGRSAPLRPLFIVLGFVTAFAGVALAFSLFAEAIGISAGALRTLGVFLIAAFGLLMIFPRLLEVATAPVAGLVNRAADAGQKTGPGHLGGFVLGMTLGAVWTPCAGPVLGSILTLVATAADPARSALLLIAYAAGAGIPMLLIAYGGQYVSGHVRGLARYSRRLQEGFGVLIVLTAVAIHFHYDLAVAAWLAGFYPQGRPGL